MGALAEAISKDAAILLSIALQHGVELDTLAHAITRNEDGTASSFMGVLVDQLIKDRKNQTHG
jgi:hypothetical protein